MPRSMLGSALARFLAKPRHVHGVAPVHAAERLRACLRVGDVLLVEGSSRFSVAIKYLTQSNWSHAALFVGALPAGQGPGGDAVLVEADVNEGVRAVPLDMYAGMATRICRPVGLTEEERGRVAAYAIARLGYRYDLRNVIDLMRYLIATPPVPTQMRRRMLALGSGDPTRAICSTLIAQAFQSIRYPILPTITERDSDAPDCPGCVDEILHVRHHSLFAPRDFDVSPYFEIVKPSIVEGFDPHLLHWDDPAQAARA